MGRPFRSVYTKIKNKFSSSNSTLTNRSATNGSSGQPSSQDLPPQDTPATTRRSNGEYDKASQPNDIFRFHDSLDRETYEQSPKHEQPGIDNEKRSSGRLESHVSSATNDTITSEVPSQVPSITDGAGSYTLDTGQAIYVHQADQQKNTSLNPTRGVIREGGKELESEIIDDGAGPAQIIIRRSSTYLEPDQNARVPESDEIEAVEEGITIVLPYDPPLRRPKSVRSQPYHDDLRNLMLPKGIVCNLTVTFNEEKLVPSGPFTFKDFAWMETGEYSKLRDKFEEIKKTFLQRDHCKDHKIYVRYGSCFLRGTRDQDTHEFRDRVLVDIDEDSNDEKEDNDIDKDHATEAKDKNIALSDAAIQLICGFIHQYPCEQFELNFHFDCSSIEQAFNSKQPWPPNNSHFTSAIRYEYKSKMSIGRETINHQGYLSDGDQHVLITPENARRLVDYDRDSKPPLTDQEKEELKDGVVTRPAYILQAVCAYDDIPMRFLYHFLFEEPHKTRKHSDHLETLDLHLPGTCNHELCRKYRQGLIKHVYQFNPERITVDPVHSRKSEHAIIPIRYATEVKELGRGAFSIVYEVDIDPHYQLISPNITKTYALKKFNTTRTDKADFDREMKMLLYLSSYLPHDHILVHITSWEQNSEYYILYEKAHCNLRGYMKRFRGGDLTKKRVLWFLFQLRGLSDAVRRIHTCRESVLEIQSRRANGPNGGTTITQPSQAKKNKTGVVGLHHDIKPENILAFDLPENLPTFKLSDFGSGKFSAADKKSSAQPASKVRGTYTYIGPESQADMGKKMTRPFDMWALGCVFLEFLLWFVDKQKPDGENHFADMRTSEPWNTSPEKEDYFWMRRGPKDYVLNGAVVYALDVLQDKACKGISPLQELITLLRKLLVIQPESRMNSKDLHHSMDAICGRAHLELLFFPTAYADRFQSNKYPEEKPNPPLPTIVTGLDSIQRIDDDVSVAGRSRAQSTTTEPPRMEDPVPDLAPLPSAMGTDQELTLANHDLRDNGALFPVSNQPETDLNNVYDVMRLGPRFRPRTAIQKQVNETSRMLSDSSDDL